MSEQAPDKEERAGEVDGVRIGDMVPSHVPNIFDSVKIKNGKKVVLKCFTKKANVRFLKIFLKNPLACLIKLTFSYPETLQMWKARCQFDQKRNLLMRDLLLDEQVAILEYLCMA